jgi:hypothetical protein
MNKHHLVYRTTNLLNGRYYIGIHSTSNIDDGYLGSGRRIKAEIKKYGQENFKREILESYPTRQEVLKREAELVTEELRQDSLCLNLKNGGEGGWEHLNDNSEVQRAKGRKGNASIKILANDPIWAASRSAAISNGLRGKSAGWSEQATMASHTDEVNQKRSRTMKDLARQSGQANSQFGTCWVTNGFPIKIKKQDLDSYLTNGYVRGRTKQWCT